MAKKTEMFRLYEEGGTEVIIEMPYHKDKTRVCRTCSALNDFEFCEDLGLGFDESIDLDTFRGCEMHSEKRRGR